MKKMKLFTGFVAAAMAAVSLSVMTNAAETPVSVKIGEKKVNPGENFSVDVDLSNVPSGGLTSIDFAISYDSSLIDISDVKLGTVGDTGAKSAEGDLGDTVFDWYKKGDQIVIIWATGLTDSQYWVKSDGTFLTISGSAKANATEGGSSPLKGVAVDRAAYPGGSANKDIVFSAVGSDNSVTDYGAKFTDGSISIGNPTGTTLSQPTSGPSENEWGNADCSADGVKLADAVLVARVAANDKTATITDDGRANADVTHDGAIDSKDLTKLLKFLAGIITEADLAKA